MNIINTYTKLQESPIVKNAHPVFKSWGYSDLEVSQWFKERSYQMITTSSLYLEKVHDIVQMVEHFFKTTLPGELVLIPSMGEIDGFARYDHGHHTVMLGIDFPDASLDYLKALTAHELSHVYRDHSPEVWEFLGKPLSNISREEYLEATTGREHLISEGLATLTSQAIFPDVPLSDHHYYELDEMNWCIANDSKINLALENNLKLPDPNPWRFYSPNVVEKGSPSRTHYYWAAQKIDTWIKNTPNMSLLKAHSLPTNKILAF